MRVTKEQIKEDLIFVKNKLNKYPSKQDYENHGKHSTKTIRKVFKSWRNALEETFNITMKSLGEPKQLKKCINCDNLTKNPKFCCRPCGAEYNNKNYIKRKPIFKNHCRNCNQPISHLHTHCLDCRNNNFIKTKYTEGLECRKYAYALIRREARKLAKKHNMLSCAICGYSKHVEIAHIKAVSLFAPQTPITEINALENLIPLCRNHHWELDQNKLDYNLKSLIENYHKK